MVDNHPEDKYFYEIIVETGPKDAHATTAKISFILSGSEEETDVRSVCVSDKPVFQINRFVCFKIYIPIKLRALNGYPQFLIFK